MQPSGAATPRNSDAHERIAVPKAFCVLRERLRPRPKSGKVRRSDTRPGDIRERAARIEGSDSGPIRNNPCFAVCALVCDLSLKAECVPAFACKSEHGPFVREVENAMRNGWEQRCDGNFLAIFAGVSIGEKSNFLSRIFE